MSELDATTSIQNTLALYCHCVDDRRHSELIECFAPDGELVYQGQIYAGHEALLAFWQTPRKGKPGKHFTTNTLLDIRGDHATAVSDFMFVLPDHTMGGLGRYTDELALLDRRWVFTRRQIDLLDDGS